MTLQAMVKKIMTSTLLALFILSTSSWVAAAENEAISKQQAIAIVKNTYSGKVLKAKLIEHSDFSFYKIKLLTKKGRVKQVRVDRRTGNILD